MCTQYTFVKDEIPDTIQQILANLQGKMKICRIIYLGMNVVHADTHSAYTDVINTSIKINA